MQQQVHGGQSRGGVDQLVADQRLVPQVLELGARQRVAASDVLMGCEEEACGAAGRVDDDLSRVWPGHLDHGVNDCPGGEVLARTGLGVLSALLQ